MPDLNNPDLYINRELSWLRFNTRVLLESEKRSNPLLERLKFIAIYGTNLDEFYMIRVAGLKQLFSTGIVTTGDDHMTPLEQLKAIRDYLHEEKLQVEISYKEIVQELLKENLVISDYEKISEELKEEAQEYFFKNIFPVIIPIAVDATHPFPHLNNLSFSLAVKLEDKDNPEETKYGMVRIPRLLPRFIQLGDNIYIPIESLIEQNIDTIFPGYSLLTSAAFRVTRNADIVIEEEEADDFMEIMEQGLRLRKKGAFVRLEIQRSADEELIEFLNSHLKIFRRDIYKYDIPLNLGALWQIVGNKKFSHLKTSPYTPKIIPPLDSSESVFHILDREEVLLYHPYESFEPVTKLIKTAAKDPKVLSIRMTLYRVGKNSPIIQALIDAANNGKQVTAMVELKARFDEENNLIWAKALEDAGAHVIYGISGFKVHAKITQIIRQVNDGLKIYTHFATGNYNTTTAKIYTDVSFMTSKDEFAEDATRFFHILTGFSKYKKLNKLSMSPTQIKQKILYMIEMEKNKKEAGRIIAKMNSLVDTDVIKALYKASMAGTKIDLIVRGICCLKPQIEGISENIRVFSIIGKYLEHARIFYFKHANPNIFISSADWMPRNLERRIELMTPIYNKNLSQKLYEILQLQLHDTFLKWQLQSDASYKKVMPPNDQKPLNSQEFLENYINKIYKSVKKHNPNSKKSILAKHKIKDS